MAFSMDARLIILLSLDKARSSVLAMKKLGFSYSTIISRSIALLKIR